MATKKLKILFLSFIFICSQTLFAQEPTPLLVKKSKKITGWETMTVKSGFILSNELYYQRNCANTWSYQIPEFEKKNPKVADVNKFWPGNVISIQKCGDKIAKNSCDLSPCAPPKSKKTKAKKIIPAEPEYIIPAEVVSSPVKEEKPAVVYEDEDMMIFAGLGFLSEKYRDSLYSNVAFRYGLKKELYPRFGYKLSIDFSPSVIFASNKVQLKTAPDVRQYYFSYGVGNRIGLQKRDIYKVSDNLNSYSLAGVGLLFKKNGVDFDVELGTTLNSKPSLNVSIMGVKKITEKLSLGGYFDYLSSDPKVTETDTDRKVITGGILVQF